MAVNVFWRHLPRDVYDHKDVYGNRDLLPAARATQIVDRAVKTLHELPVEYADFYARLLIERIKRKTFTKDSVSDKSKDSDSDKSKDSVSDKSKDSDSDKSKDSVSDKS